MERSSLLATIFMALAAMFILSVSGGPTSDPTVVPNFPVPTIAIVTSPVEDCPGPPPGGYSPFHSCIRGTYIQWLQAAGVRVIPLRWDDPFPSKENVLSQVNGVLFAGGGMDVQPNYAAFYAQICQIVNLARKWNEEGDSFVVFGVCQGFQMISACGAGSLDAVVDGYQGMYPLMMPLNFTADAMTSKFLGSAPSSIIDALKNHASTLNYHHEGVKPVSFEAGSKLAEEYVVTSTNEDVTGLPFVSTFEARNAAIYATQWHPEWPAFDWSNEDIGKTNNDIAVSQWVGRFVRERLLENNHTFSSAMDVENLVIDNFPRSYSPFGVLRYWIGGVPVASPDGSTASLAVILMLVGSAVAFLMGAACGREIMRRSLVKTKDGEVYTRDLE